MTSVNKIKENQLRRLDFVPSTIPDDSQTHIAANYEVCSNSNDPNDTLIILKPKGTSKSAPKQQTQNTTQTIDGDPENYFTPPPKVLFPRSQLTDMLTWRRPEPPGSGLVNQGHTCFMDAALQCLYYTPPFANFITSYEHRNCLLP